MNNFGSYITPEKAKEFGDANGDKRSLEQWRKLADRKARRCLNCNEFEWKYAETGLCFSCTTGEADAGEDMELDSSALVYAHELQP